MENIIDFKRLHHKLSAKEVADIESMTRKEIFILRGMKRWIKNERLSGYGERGKVLESKKENNG